MFSILLNVFGTLMHLYVSERLYRIPAFQARVSPRAWWAGVLAVWLFYIWGVQLGDEALDWRWWPGQFAMMWLGVLFLMSLCLLVVDIPTAFGFLWRRQAPRLLAGAAVAGVLVSAFAIYQAVRAPAVVEHELVLDDLPAALDGTVLVALSDLHLGAQRGVPWMAGRVEQINAIDPDLGVLVGDQVEDNPVGEAALSTVLRRVRARWGIWAVTGNHEYYGDAESTIAEFEAGGVRWLRDRAVELAPGLVLAGIEDIGKAMRSGEGYLERLDRTLPEAGAGSVILLAHIPAAPLVDKAARMGVDLMLSGHTHGGQIWPFSYLVERRFPTLAGPYAVRDMTLVVSRGAGSWGPRMRLWQPGEILKLTLRSPAVVER